MAVFFFMQYFVLKKREHLFYSFYLFTVTAYYPLAMPDVFFHVSLTNENIIAGFDLFKRPIQFLVNLFYTCFVIYYLNLKQNASKLHKIFVALNYAYALLALACLMLNYLHINYNTAYFVISLFVFPVQIYVLILLFKKKVKYSYYIISGSIILVLGSILSLINSVWLIKPDTNLSQANADSYLSIQVAIVLDIFLFSFALQRKIADNEKSLINAAYQRQQAILLERERIIADLHDDVGGGLSSIRMMSDLMSQQTNPENNKASSFAPKISATAKEIAQRMHTIIWSLNVENDSLQNFAEYVRQYGVSFFENTPIKFECSNLNDLASGVQLSGVQRKNLFLIIKEALHNILKHSHASIAAINISLEKSMLFIKVNDNGNGISNENIFGNGLKNMKKRMDEVGGNVDITSNNGTVISISVKL
jgi:signal transduction histidine kinase